MNRIPQGKKQNNSDLLSAAEHETQNRVEVKDRSQCKEQKLIFALSNNFVSRQPWAF